MAGKRLHQRILRRVFNPDGKPSTQRFSYLSSLPAGSEVLVDDFLNDGGNGIFLAMAASCFASATAVFGLSSPLLLDSKSMISLAAGDINGDGKAGNNHRRRKGRRSPGKSFFFRGQGYIKFFSLTIRISAAVFNVAAGDINGDGKAEIITGAGLRRRTPYRYFNQKRLRLSVSFSLTTKISTAVLTLPPAISTVTASGNNHWRRTGGGPQVRIFNI